MKGKEVRGNPFKLVKGPNLDTFLNYD